MEKELWLKMSDNHELSVTVWSVENPRVVLQVVHGMAEHIKRYREFANYLVSQGIIVYGNDHRGHGQTGKKTGPLGFFAENDGFERAVKDLLEVNNYILKEHPNCPVFMLGHSMGSFLVRRFIQRFQGRLKGVILSGTGGNPGVMGRVGKLLARQQMEVVGQRTECKFLNHLTFRNYNKKIINRKTEFDWLSRDENIVKGYIDDPYCGFVATAGFYYDLLKGLEKVHQKKEIEKIEKDLPIFVFSGEQDPVGNYTKGVRSVIQQYQKHGVTKIEYTFYKEGRHEMLNETNRQQVIERIVSWINKHIS